MEISTLFVIFARDEFVRTKRVISGNHSLCTLAFGVVIFRDVILIVDDAFFCF